MGIMDKMESQNNETDKPKVRRIVDAAFAARLEKACDDLPDVPPKNHGRLGYIIKKFEEVGNDRISGETVRKWFYGESRPRPSKMRTLARILGVSNAWLSLGDSTDIDGGTRKKRDLALGGVIDLVAGLVQLDGGVISFVQDKDPRAKYVQMYAAIKGATYAIHSAYVVDQAGVLKTSVPSAYADCTVVGVIRTGGTCFDMVEVGTDAVNAHGIKRNGVVELQIERSEGVYYAKSEKGKTMLTRIPNFANRL